MSACPAARGKLERRDIEVICTGHFFNEKGGPPSVCHTLLLLRPTASATLFLQQIAPRAPPPSIRRRAHPPDFIGQHRAEFRFEGLYEALTGVPRGKLERAVSGGRPLGPRARFGPSGAEGHPRWLEAPGAQHRRAHRGQIRDLSAESQGETPALASYLRAIGSRTVE